MPTQNDSDNTRLPWPPRIVGKLSCARSVALSFLACAVVASDTHASTEGSDQSAEAVAQCDPLGSASYWVEEIARGLRFPSSIVWIENNSAVISEREGGLRLLRGDRLDPRNIQGVPQSFQNAYNGIKDLVLDPDFGINRMIYLLISEGNYDQHHAAVYRARYTQSGLKEVTRIFRSKDELGGPGPASSRLLLLSDRSLLVAVPEDDSHKPLAQRLDSHVGKILRINLDGSIPLNNPFIDTPNALPEIWSYGHRVPTGLFTDPETDTIWEVEPGPLGGDELNLLTKGGNFGWAAATWGFDYSGALAAPSQSSPGVTNPLLIWTPSVTPSGILRYRGSRYPFWNDDFFVGHLSGRAIERIRMKGRSLESRQQMLVDLQERIRDVKVGPDGLIYLLTDHQNGRVLRIRPGRVGDAEISRIAHRIEETWAGLERSLVPVKPGDPKKGKEAFMDRCAGCHRVGTVVSGGNIGPDLDGVYGRTMGSRTDYSYSSAMARSSQVWTNVSLNLLLADPSSYLPGTKMSAPPVTDDSARRDIVGFLKSVSVK